LLRVEHFFDQMDLYQRHCHAPLCRPRPSEVTDESIRMVANPRLSESYGLISTCSPDIPEILLANV
jgi:hypothetical protein